MSKFRGLLAYSNEQLEPISRLVLSFIITYFISILFAHTFKQSIRIQDIFVPSISTFLLLVYYRVSDEFKDFETDKLFFPDRPVPSGKITLNDLRNILIAVSVISIGINLIFSFALKEFIAAYIFTFAMGKWFFMEKIISKNRLIAFFTHAPVGLFLYGYTEVYLLIGYKQHLNVAPMISLVCFFLLPGITWEILRKTYLPQDEMPGYQIYSTILGFKGSLLFALTWVFITIVNNYLLIRYFPILDIMNIPLLLINIIMVGIIIFHSQKPLAKNLKKVAETYMALLLIVPMIYLIWKYYA